MTTVPACCKLACLATLLWAAGNAMATDPYEPDNAYTTGLLIHGHPQSRDLEGTSNADYIAIDPVPGHSYEVRLFSPQYRPYFSFTRLSGAYAVVQTGWGYYFNSTRTDTGRISSANSVTSSPMNWIEPPEGDASRSRYIRVRDTGTTARTALETEYVVEMRETTLYCARYNNTGTQRTVLIVQRTHPDDSLEADNGCDWQVRFYDQSSNFYGHTLNGTAKGSNTLGGTGLYPNGMVVIDTTTVPGVANTRGSMQIDHTCSYGGVQAKAVSVEPATGFAFDTICAPRPN